MKWTIRLGKVFGIELSMHATFLLLLFFVAVSQYRAVGTVAGAVSGVAFMLAVFSIVVLHELGHAVTAMRFGVHTRDIILLPIGGVARLDRMPERPLHELLVAIAGPAVSVGLALLLALVAQMLSQPLSADWSQPLTFHTVLGRLVWVNVSLAVFNLIPAFPLDGGRVLRATLAMRMNYVSATQTAARVGRSIALVLGTLGLFVNPMITLIAVFIWITAAAEAGSVEATALLKGTTVRQAMVTQFESLPTTATLAEAAERLLAGAQVDFPVLEDGRLAGILTRTGLIAGLARGGQQVLVRDAMVSAFESATPGEALDAVLARLRVHVTHTAPVLDEGRVIGLLTLDNVGELLAVRGALRTGLNAGAGLPA